MFVSTNVNGDYSKENSIPQRILQSDSSFISSPSNLNAILLLSLVTYKSFSVLKNAIFKNVQINNKITYIFLSPNSNQKCLGLHYTSYMYAKMHSFLFYPFLFALLLLALILFNDLLLRVVYKILVIPEKSASRSTPILELDKYTCNKNMIIITL